MNIETLRQHYLSKPGAEEGQPFGPDNLVFKVGGKMFLLASLDTVPLRFNAKCRPEDAEALRERYPAVQPGYHMNKRHWNTVTVDGSVPDALLRQWIDEAYRLVRQGLSKTIQQLPAHR